MFILKSASPSGGRRAAAQGSGQGLSNEPVPLSGRLVFENPFLKTASISAREPPQLLPSLLPGALEAQALIPRTANHHKSYHKPLHKECFKGSSDDDLI